MKFYDFKAISADSIAAFDEGGKTLYFGEFDLLSTKLEQVVESRRVCLILTQNSIDCFVGVVSLMNCGVVPLLVDLNSNKAFIEHLISVYSPEYLYAPSTITKSVTDYIDIKLQGEYSLCAHNQPFPNVVNPDLALLLSTSGSTGSPKLVRQSRSNLKSNGSSIIECLGIGSADRPITSLPMHYTFGFSVINSHLMTGATVLMSNRSVTEKEFWNFFRENEGTSIAGVPFTYTALKRLGLNKLKLPSLSTLTQAGGKLAKPIIDEFAQFAHENGIKFFVMYGQTEATARMSFVPTEFALKKAGSIGIPIPNGEFFLIDGDDKLIQLANQEGQLGYRGPNVTMGYAENRLDLLKGDERGGVLLTGDVAYRDEDGYYFITGRLSRFVKVFGKRVSLDDIEHLLHSIAGEVACSGVDDNVSVWITDTNSPKIVRKHIADITGIHPSAFTIHVIKTLPRTLAGKVDYQNLLLEKTHD